MNYCALDDAFQTIGITPSPGCTNDYAGRTARKEERRKARRCKGPQANYLDISDKDPDRQHLNKLPDAPVMNKSTGLRENTSIYSSEGTFEPFLPRNDNDIIGDQVRSQIPLNIPGTTEIQQPTTSRKKFFGADPDGDTFADYVPDSKDYKLQPDFLNTFDKTGVTKAGSTSTLPNPSVNMFWKPLTPSGTQTSFIEHLPPPGGQYYTNNNSTTSNNEIMKKLDMLWARLDDMNTSSPEQITSEILMFISSGIFVLFMMDLLVKKGSKIRF